MCFNVSVYLLRTYIFNANKYTQTILHIGRAKSIKINQYSTSFKEQKIAVDGININYVKAGEGDHTALLCPGALGSIWTDFKPQIVGLSKSKLTVVAWDPPGYGRSRPPDRDFSPGFFRRDADLAAGLMRELGHKRYSLLGWSDGGITAMILAAKHPQRVQKLVVWGSHSYIVQEEVKTIEKLNDINKWSDKMKAPLFEIYGEEYYTKAWGGWCNSFFENYSRGGDLCKDSLPKIECPTLIVHGSKDPMLAEEHVKYNLDNIKNSRLHVFEDGKHNLHQKYSNEFNKLIEDFLLSNNE